VLNRVETVTALVTVTVPVDTVIVVYLVSYLVTVFVAVIVGADPSLLNVNWGGMNPVTCARRVAWSSSAASESTESRGFSTSMPYSKGT